MVRRRACVILSDEKGRLKMRNVREVKQLIDNTQQELCFSLKAGNGENKKREEE